MVMVALAFRDCAHMTPDEIKISIRAQYQRLLQRDINRSAIPGLIKSRAQEGARHNGVPELWRNYMPLELLSEEIGT